MDIKVSGKNTIDVVAALPASKSISNRMLVIRELSGGRIKVDNLSDCDDTFVMERALGIIHDAVLRSNVTLKSGDTVVPNPNSTEPVTIDIMAAGTSMRFLTALLSTILIDAVITGTERMLHRPIGILVDALRQLGANIDYVNTEGFPPLRIKGGDLAGGAIEMRGDVSSQYISALMMIAPTMKNGLQLKIVGKLASRPYIEMTAGLMRRFGVDVMEENDGDGVHIINIKDAEYGKMGGGVCAGTGECNNKQEFVVESDWSAASYWYEMLALAKSGQIVLKGLCDHSLQGDSVVRRLFEPLGVRTEFRDGDAFLVKSAPTIDFYRANLNTCPDLAQTMVATCCAMGVRFRFEGLESLRIKETDRLTALRQELAKLGFVIHEENGRVLYWDGERTTPVSPVSIATYNDHRMAMCLAPLAMLGRQLIIQDAGVVSKSYPAFWEELEKAGFSIETIERKN